MLLNSFIKEKKAFCTFVQAVVNKQAVKRGTPGTVCLKHVRHSRVETGMPRNAVKKEVYSVTFIL